MPTRKTGSHWNGMPAHFVALKHRSLAEFLLGRVNVGASDRFVARTLATKCGSNWKTMPAMHRKCLLAVFLAVHRRNGRLASRVSSGSL